MTLTIPNSAPSLRHQPQLRYPLVPTPSLRSPASLSINNVPKPLALRAIQLESSRTRCSRRRPSWRLCVVRASTGALDSGGCAGARSLKGMIHALPPAISVVQRNITSKFAVGIYVAFALIAVAVRQIMHKKQSQDHQGSVADLVRRGQLRSDRRGISKPLKYDDPFNNPLVKVSKNDATIEICGKVYRLAPVTLTEKQQSEHQRRRSRAYQWKRPKVFLKEGDPIPPDVDPDTVRWVPSNHPFAKTVSDIDEKMAQDNVYQKDGVPSRIKAEHEALQRKLEALQNGGSYNEGPLNLRGVQDSEGGLGSSLKPQEQIDPIPSPLQQHNDAASNSDNRVSSGDTLLDQTRRKS